MDEHDVHQLMRDVLERSCPPPAMDPLYAVEQGRRAVRRRTAVWAAVTAVPLVVTSARYKTTS